ncbi:hypothetical protein [Streptomyces sp. CAI 127]|uniref:hypothetical protein n=1 Tax=Streptomyces sp. CAI 127 TaxID=1076397 RepID=UPI0015877673|nr:hypothetical protein [Streptomyces sp. CAI 127]NUV99779.1 hypothetical protein [Streptomyces sp. CAI 127]
MPADDSGWAAAEAAARRSGGGLPLPALVVEVAAGGRQGPGHFKKPLADMKALFDKLGDDRSEAHLEKHFAEIVGTRDGINTWMQDHPTATADRVGRGGRPSARASRQGAAWGSVRKRAR